MKELADFERRYVEKLGLAMMVDAEQMAAMAATSACQAVTGGSCSPSTCFVRRCSRPRWPRA
jgi:hypothetical protein